MFKTCEDRIRSVTGGLEEVGLTKFQRQMNEGISGPEGSSQSTAQSWQIEQWRSREGRRKERIRETGRGTKMEECEIPPTAVDGKSGSRQISLRINGGCFRAFPERSYDNSVRHHDASKRPLYGKPTNEVGV